MRLGTRKTISSIIYKYRHIHTAQSFLVMYIPFHHHLAVGSLSSLFLYIQCDKKEMTGSLSTVSAMTLRVLSRTKSFVLRIVSKRHHTCILSSSSPFLYFDAFSICLRNFFPRFYIGEHVQHLSQSSILNKNNTAYWGRRKCHSEWVLYSFFYLKNK